MTNRAPRPWLAATAGLCIVLTSCAGGQQDGDTPNTDTMVAPSEPIDAAIVTRNEAIMGIHDEVMPERAKLVRLQRELERAPENNLAYSSARSRLTAADDAMMAWMYGDVPLTELVDSLPPEALSAYLDERERSIRAVADSMRESMRYAEQTLAAQK